MTSTAAISGAYKELYVVDAAGSERPVGYLYGEFTLSTGATEITIEAGGSSVAATLDGHKQLTAEFSSFYVPPAATLKELGLVDETGALLLDDEWAAARLYLYDRSPDRVAERSDAVDGWELPRFRPRLDEAAFPSDSEAALEVSARVNGRPRRFSPEGYGFEGYSSDYGGTSA